MITAEAPDDTAIANAILSIAPKAALQIETMRAFTGSEYHSIVSGL